MKAQSVLLLASVVICMSGGQVLFKHLANQLRDVDLASATGTTRAISEPLLWVAIGLYGLTTVLWLLLLRGADLSRVYPLVLATSLLLVSAASVVLFSEHISAGGFIGSAVIFVGLCTIALAG